VAFADGDLVDAHRPGRGQAGASHLLPHIELVEILDRGVVQPLKFSHRLHRHLAAERTYVQRIPLRITRIPRKPIELLYEHAATPRAVNSPALELEEDAEARRTHVAHPHRAAIVAPPAAMTAARAPRCVFRRRSSITRARRSPNTPTNPDEAVKPGNEKSAQRDL